MHGPHEARMCRIVPKRVPNLGDEIDEVLLDDERVGPEPLLQGDLRQRLRTIRDQDLQKLIRFRRERHRIAPVEQLACIGVQHKGTKAHHTHFKPSTTSNSERKRTWSWQ